jgi:hypothetical protein
MNKKKVEFVKTSTFDGDGPVYRVVKLTNCVDPVVGSHISAKEIRKFIESRLWTVVIREGKSE